MKIKKEYVILVVLILALSLYLILRNRDRIHYRIPDLNEINRKDISRIEISKKDLSIVINTKDEKWLIGPMGYPADDNKIKGMLDTIETLTLTALVSESKNYDRYSLDDARKIHVKAWSGDRLLREFSVGKTAPSYRHTFVLIPEDPRVYHAEGNFRNKFDEGVDSLRDKIVLSFDQNEIQEIHLTKGDQSLVLGRKQVPVEVSAGKRAETQGAKHEEAKMVWQSADGREVDETALNRLLTSLSSLRCEKYADDRKKEDFKDPVYTIQLRGTQEYTLSLFEKIKKEDKSTPAISSTNDYLFFLAEGQAKNVIKAPEEMLKKSVQPLKDQSPQKEKN